MATPRYFIAGTSTDVAPVATLPTTAAQFVLWNGEPAGGKVYAISSIGYTTTTSAGAVIVVQPLANVSQSPVTVPSGTAALGPLPTDGGPITSKASALSAVTIVNSGIWHPVGQAVVCAGTANIGLGTWTNVNGIYYLQPGGILSLAGFCSAAGSAKGKFFVTWSEA